MSRSASARAALGSVEPNSATVGAMLERGVRMLDRSCGPDARREARFLLAGVLEVNPGQVWRQRDLPLSNEAQRKYARRLERRARGEPLQYVEGRAAFRELWLQVNRSVMIPRPETACLVDCVLEWCRGRERLRAADIGTGSGGVAISLALEGPFEHIVGVDISADALKVAGENVAEAAVDASVQLRLGSFFDALRPGERFHVVVSNPPYIARREADLLPAEVRDWEPPEALYAGATGLEAIGRLVEDAPGYLEAGGLLALEVAPHQISPTRARLRARGAYGEPWVIADMAARPRVVLAEHSG